MRALPIPARAAEPLGVGALEPLGRLARIGGRADFPLHDWALTQQSGLLAQLLDPVVLARVRDAELGAAPGRPTWDCPRCTPG